MKRKPEQFFTLRDDVQEVIFRWSAVASRAGRSG